MSFIPPYWSGLESSNGLFLLAGLFCFHRSFWKLFLYRPIVVYKVICIDPKQVSVLLWLKLMRPSIDVCATASQQECSLVIGHQVTDPIGVSLTRLEKGTEKPKQQNLWARQQNLWGTVLALWISPVSQNPGGFFPCNLSQYTSSCLKFTFAFEPFSQLSLY